MQRRAVLRRGRNSRPLEHVADDVAPRPAVVVAAVVEQHPQVCAFAVGLEVDAHRVVGEAQCGELRGRVHAVREVGRDDVIGGDVAGVQGVEGAAVEDGAGDVRVAGGGAAVLAVGGDVEELCRGGVVRGCVTGGDGEGRTPGRLNVEGEVSGFGACVVDKAVVHDARGVEVVVEDLRVLCVAPNDEGGGHGTLVCINGAGLYRVDGRRVVVVGRALRLDTANDTTHDGGYQDDSQDAEDDEEGLALQATASPFRLPIGGGKAVDVLLDAILGVSDGDQAGGILVDDLVAAREVDSVAVRHLGGTEDLWGCNHGGIPFIVALGERSQLIAQGKGETDRYVPW